MYSTGANSGAAGQAAGLNNDQMKALGGMAKDQIMAAAPEYVDKLKQITKNATDGTYSQKRLSVVGGAYMAVIGIFGIISDVFSLAAIDIVLHLYVSFFGIIVVVLEAKGALFTQERKDKIIYYFRAMAYVWGRGVFFIFCCSVMFSIGGLLCWIGGAYMAALGIFMIVTGSKSSKHLGSLKGEIRNDKHAAKLFHKYDADHSGALDTREFAKLAKDLGHELTHPLLESTIMQLDADRSGTIDMKEFMDWYHSKNELFDIPGVQSNVSMV